jgi:uncharacterized protein
MTDGATKPAHSRIQTLDLVRGVAVMMIVSVNINVFAFHQAAYMNPTALGIPSLADMILWAVNLLLVDGKFYALFAMLFGASMLIVIERAEARGDSGWMVHLRRMIFLFLIGLVHALFIWHGDILTSYALTGIIAYAFRRASVRTLILWGIGLTLADILLFGAIAATLYTQEASVAAGHPTAEIARNWAANRSSFFPDPPAVAKDLALYKGSYIEITAHQLGHWAQILVNALVIFPSTLGLMAIGMAAYRSGFLTGAWSDSAYRRFAAIAIGIGILAHAGLLWAEINSNYSPAVLVGGVHAAMAPFRIVQGLGYAALIILLGRNMGPFARRIAAVGRTAFSNYLGTSILGTTLFYGWGLGLYGELSRFEAWLLVPVMLGLMLLWSKPWLDRFAYGPFEWLWRSLSRWKLQPMRKRLPANALATEA